MEFVDLRWFIFRHLWTTFNLLSSTDMREALVWPQRWKARSRQIEKESRLRVKLASRNGLMADN